LALSKLDNFLTNLKQDIPIKASVEIDLKSTTTQGTLKSTFLSRESGSENLELLHLGYQPTVL